ncbi:HlyD family efflux transporter periplasmic adaptor subunit [Candidatus Kaiserbacteria bacterium]|nr:HlyD family efflux transporter periplasmic adaptor subunit [Candidatus Kaiserbacteria bacterium]
MTIFQKIKMWSNRKSVRVLFGLLLVVFAINLLGKRNDNPVVDATNKYPVVQLTSSAIYAGEQTLSVIGTVRAFSEAAVTAESSGRVVSVRVDLGDEVPAGTVLATLENAAEQAAVLQAEGVYEAALAAAAQTNLGIDEAEIALNNAEINVITTSRSAFNTVNNIIETTIDRYYNQPQSLAARLKIGMRGYDKELERARVSLGKDLSVWQEQLEISSNESDLNALLNTSESIVNDLLSIVDTFLTVFSDQTVVGKYQADLVEFTTLRTSVISLVSSLNNAKSGLNSAETALKRAQLAASGSNTSSADAQVKQALGTLRSAQANLSRTILRTPIAGTVNSLNVKAGDYLNAMSEVAVVANNNALEVVTFVSDNDRELIEVGDLVIIEGDYEGVITHVAPAVDSLTRKTEVRIATEGTEIANGDTVRIEKNVILADTKPSTTKIPLTAVKFERENGFVMQVKDNKLVAVPVVLGAVFGGSVEVKEGLESSDKFVKDVRGLVVGESVEVIE